MCNVYSDRYVFYIFNCYMKFWKIIKKCCLLVLFHTTEVLSNDLPNILTCIHFCIYANNVSKYYQTRNN